MTTATVRDETILDAFLFTNLAAIESYISTLDHLTAAACLDDLADHLRHVLVPQEVSAARLEGCSWDQIGAALGVARQSAHQRFS
jgi:hypothetical protein